VLKVLLFSKLKDQASNRIDCDQSHNQERRDDNGFITVRVKLIPQDKERQYGVSEIDYGYHFNILVYGLEGMPVGPAFKRIRLSYHRNKATTVVTSRSNPQR
jgi:hypothetical protein